MTLDWPELPAYWMELAVRDLRSARLLFEDGDTDGAANRTYYAMFHAATAAFAARGVVTKTHDALVGQFGREFVESGLIARDLGRAFNVALELRRAADYVAAPPPADRVERVIGDAERFVAAVRALLDAPRS
ncbi:HEPN domain-containing protein [Azospirillum sp.]|uniref:HEPN domain-containing protein n=1 Tax=Azospirillum sp. TaxID=34012 RepID=UPI002D3DF033|nr:HEPN domain-containing protein [Azospirillum sp.]HYD68440.1 HEPN domain-containing protein [Azospirillum sp.]